MIHADFYFPGWAVALSVDRGSLRSYRTYQATPWDIEHMEALLEIVVLTNAESDVVVALPPPAPFQSTYAMPPPAEPKFHSAASATSFFPQLAARQADEDMVPDTCEQDASLVYFCHCCNGYM